MEVRWIPAYRESEYNNAISIRASIYFNVIETGHWLSADGGRHSQPRGNALGKSVLEGKVLSLAFV